MKKLYDTVILIVLSALFITTTVTIVRSFLPDFNEIESRLLQQNGD